MRNKMIAVALVVMLLGAGLVLMSCSKCPGSGDCKIDFATVEVNPDKLVSGWCAYSVEDQKDAEVSAECAVTKDVQKYLYDSNFDTSKVSECDC